jgi:uncharacterized membrane protein YhiD involved in acid resistance
MRQEFQDIFVYSLSAKDAAANILIALICGSFIALLYRITYRGLSFSASFVNSIIMLTMITALVIMVIGNNLARAFGLVGAMSIIRFRTAVKDSQDIMFIFFALAIGLAAGVGLYSVTIVGTFLIGTILFLVSKLNYANPKKREYLLQIICKSSSTDNSNFENILQNYCSKHKMINVKALGEESKDLLELSYYINLKNQNKSQEFIKEIKNFPGVNQVNVFFDEE